MRYSFNLSLPKSNDLFTEIITSIDLIYNFVTQNIMLLKKNINNWYSKPLMQ